MAPSPAGVAGGGGTDSCWGTEIAGARWQSSALGMQPGPGPVPSLSGWGHPSDPELDPHIPFCWGQTPLPLSINPKAPNCQAAALQPTAPLYDICKPCPHCPILCPPSLHCLTPFPFPQLPISPLLTLPQIDGFLHPITHLVPHCPISTHSHPISPLAALPAGADPSPTSQSCWLGANPMPWQQIPAADRWLVGLALTSSFIMGSRGHREGGRTGQGDFNSTPGPAKTPPPSVALYPSVTPQPWPGSVLVDAACF